MRVRLSGDHSAYHAGSAAVWNVLRRAVDAQGLTLAQTGEYDALVVNGEGSMHHGRPTFHKKMAQLAEAVEDGRRAYLINTVWDDNPPDYDLLLQSLDGIIARDRMSQDQLSSRHGAKATLAPDLSYFAPAAPPPDFPDYGQAVAVTDFLDPGLTDFRWWDGLLENYPAFDLKAMSWGEAVAALQSVSVLVTGRHHAIYAACKARTRFIPVRSNCHKMEAVAASAGVSIPLAETPEEALDLIGWARENPDVFDRLFEWMEAQRPEDGFPGLGAAARQ